MNPPSELGGPESCREVGCRGIRGRAERRTHEGILCFGLLLLFS